ncbi:type II toxin-antitoxin system VapC family toxin [Rivibacter subsaxonicus]|uniref:Ribonuclease VapC n=1 Tax=Rivibacter subsaxonicus TaxID=457575 RepID=A0A4V2FUI3_9BURK|nr:type II toxin-antitoxin system VapC family toxin [Rivibacter subsaxonicus]RZU02186.1 putative nucleic acid-binding protein [Rivibacter subsaxonicus]
MSAPGPRLYVAEPPVVYALRPPVVVDCSAIAAILFQEPLRDEAQIRIEGKALHAPSLLDSEVASVALKKARQDWPAESISAAIDCYLDQAIELHRGDVSLQLELALRFELSAYDAAYLALAVQLRAPLVTFDRRLGEAAQRALGEL